MAVATGLQLFCLKSDNDECILINNKVEGDTITAGLFYAEPTKEEFILVYDTLKVLVYKLFLPPELAKSAIPQTGVNVTLKFEEV
jgi:hypothetical protein